MVKRATLDLSSQWLLTKPCPRQSCSLCVAVGYKSSASRDQEISAHQSCAQKPRPYYEAGAKENSAAGVWRKCINALKLS